MRTETRWFGPLFVGLVIGLLWLALGRDLDGSGAHAAEGARAATPPSNQPGARLVAPQLGTARSPAEAAAIPRGAEDSPSAERESDQPARRVPPEGAVCRLRVEVAPAEGVRCDPTGLVVEAQAWVESTGETTLHREPTDAVGVALFGFDREMHVDWARVLPPPGSGLAFACVEEHHDVDRGETYEVRLELQVGAPVGGRVERLDGAPVGGARVNVFKDAVDASLDDFTAGVLVIETGPDGRFDVRLPSGGWGFGVDPSQWIQVDPVLGSQEEGRDFLSIEEGEPRELARLVVARAEPLEVRVVDAADRPVIGAFVEVVPLELDRPLLPPGSGPEEPSPTELFMGTRRPLAAEPWVPVFEYESLGAATDRLGEARFHVAAGTWRVSCSPELVWEVDGRRLVQNATVPGPPLVLRWGEPLSCVRGVVVDERDEPVDGAWLELELSIDGQVSQVGAPSDAAGRFRFDGLLLAGAYELTASHGQYLTAVWTVEAREPESPDAPRRFHLRRGEQLEVVVVDSSGNAPVPGRLELRGLDPAPGLRPEDARGLDVRSSRSRANRTKRNGPEVRCYFDALPPGAAGLAWVVPEPLGTSKSIDWQTFRVSVDGAPQRIVVSLAGYSRPAQPPLAQVSGRVLDARDGAGIPGAQVHCAGPLGKIQTPALGQGSYHLGMRTGAWTLFAAAPGHAPSARVHLELLPGSQVLDFALEPGVADVVLVFQDRDGEALLGVEVELRDARGEPLVCGVSQPWGVSWQSAFYTPDGRKQVDGLPIGPLALAISFAGVELETLALDVHAGLAGRQVELRSARTLAELRAGYLAQADSEE